MFLVRLARFEAPAQLERWAQPPNLKDCDWKHYQRYHLPTHLRPHSRFLVRQAARGLAQRFNLTGRVDLYHGFRQGMTLALRECGILVC